MLSKPTCLHIPPLYEGSTAQIVWGAVDGAQGYELDVNFDEYFSSASSGKTWTDIDMSERNWSEIEAIGLSWGEFESLHEQRQYTVYKGPGEEVAGPDQSKSCASNIHIAHDVDIPFFKMRAIFRVRAYKGDEYSEYITSAFIDILRQPQTQTPQTRIAAGSRHVAVIKDSGTVWAWGDNTHGQLGDGSTNPRHSKQQVQELSDITAIASGDSHTLARQSNGAVWVWGYNYSGQLGDGTYLTSTIPLQIAIDSIRSISANAALSLALKEDGTVWGWGFGGTGQLEAPENIRINTPIQIDGLSDVSAISTGGEHCLALKSDGTVWAWGDNTYGQLGVSGPRTNSIPRQIPELFDIIAIAAGGYHNLALRSDGSVFAWGWNGEGQLGLGSTEQTILIPTQIASLPNVTCIDAGSHHSVARLANGSVLGWGHNKNGQLGLAIHGDITVPTPISQLQNIDTIAAGYNNTIAIDRSGDVHAFGEL